MTEDHKGIFVESMRRNDVFLFFNQMGEAREARESEQKIETGREIKCRPLSFYPRNTQPNILGCKNKCPPRRGMGTPGIEYVKLIKFQRDYNCNR